MFTFASFNMTLWRSRYCITDTIKNKITYEWALFFWRLSVIRSRHILLHSLNFEYDVICITESWLTSGTIGLVGIPNYNAFHTVRPNDARGGGITIYCHKRFNTDHLTQASVSRPDIETLFTKISLNGSKIIIGCVYQ